jgi:hypothetical protein
LSVTEISPQESSAPDIQKLDSLLTRQQQQRVNQENDWRMNLAFFEGDQYLRYNRMANRIDKLGIEDGEKPRYRARMVSNQILGVVNTYLSKMTKSDPVMEASPASSENHDIKAARLGEVLFQYLWDELELDAKRDEAILYSLIMGQGFLKVFWDDTYGYPVEYLIHPQTGKAVVSDDEEDILRAWSEANGVELQVERFFQGEVGVEVMSPFEVYLIGGHTPKTAYAAITVKGYSKSFVKDTWGNKAEGIEADGQYENTLNPGEAEEKNRDLVLIKEYWQKPGGERGEGKYIAWAGDVVLESKDFPYEDGELPFVKLGGIKSPGRKWDMSIVTHLRPLQKELNRSLSQIVEHKNLTVHPKWLSPSGSIEGKITSEPGQVLQYRVFGHGLKPEPIPAPGMPNYVFTHIENLLQRINDVTGQHEVTHGKVPTGVEPA